MKFLSALVLSLFLVSACSCASSIPNRVSYMENLEYSRAMQDATVGLLRGDQVSCAGVFISQDEVLTAAHCVREAGGATLGIENGHLTIIVTPAVELASTLVVTRSEFNQDVEHPSTHSHLYMVVYRNNDKDLALLRANEPSESPHSVLTPPNEHTQEGLTVGTEVFVVGHPAGIVWNISHGYISRDPLTEDGCEHLITSAPIFFGNSGGPLIDTHGHLIGITSSMRGSQGAGVANFVGLFVSANEIFHFLQAAHTAETPAQ